MQHGWWQGKKIADSVRAIVSPATPDVFSRALAEGLIKIFMDAGFCVTNPTCGACLGMSNGVLASGEVAAATTNRNFNGRMGKGGMVHLMSPATAAATALTGTITNSHLFEQSGDCHREPFAEMPCAWTDQTSTPMRSYRPGT
ncbi:MAG: aconitase family protein [Desulfotignum sp.]|nr:aconitase family protein [Desulfotignum sp.]